MKVTSSKDEQPAGADQRSQEPRSGEGAQSALERLRNLERAQANEGLRETREDEAG